MRGPIDFIVVGFEGNKFDGSVLQAIGDAVDSGVIALVSMAMVAKDAEGNVAKMNMSEASDEVVLEFMQKHPAQQDASVDDLDEVADLLENNTAAGLLVVEQLWAKPLKKALIDANGVLIAEGRIHPEAAEELSKEDK